MIIDSHHVPCTTACVHRVERRAKRAIIARRERFKVRFTHPFRSWLRQVRMCESHGNYRENTGNGFYGAYQFSLGTWFAAGGTGRPDQASPLEQDYRAVVWRLRIGNPHTTAGWPVCG